MTNNSKAFKILARAMKYLRDVPESDEAVSVIWKLADEIRNSMGWNGSGRNKGWR